MILLTLSHVPEQLCTICWILVDRLTRFGLLLILDVDTTIYLDTLFTIILEFNSITVNIIIICCSCRVFTVSRGE